MRKIYLFTFILLSAIFEINAQMGINKDGSAPDPSAMLDIKASGTTNAKGLLMPRVADHSVITTPAKGLIVFNITTNTFWFHNGTAWVNMGSGTAGNGWILKNDTLYSNNKIVGINTPIPKTTLEVQGSGFLVSQKTKLTTEDPNLHVYNMPLSGITYTDASGILYDPSGPLAPYPSGNINTSTTIIPSTTNLTGIKLTFEAFDTEANGDSIVIYNQNNEVLAKYSGNTLPPDFFYSGQILVIQFKTNGNNIVGAGFKIKWQRIDADGTAIPITGIVGNNAYFETTKGAFRSGNLGQFTDEPLGLNSVAIGYSNRAKGNFSVALGNLTNASGVGSVAMGGQTTSSGESSLASGLLSRATGRYSTAMGYFSNATSTASFAAGYQANATGNYSTAMGYSTTATSTASFASGYQSAATGNYSTAMGYSTTATSTASFASGFQSRANGNYSTAMGYFSNASTASFAAGYQANAAGNTSVAMGNSAYASGDYSTALGSSSSAYGFGSASIGHSSTAAANYSITLGTFAYAGGNYSVALGYGTNSAGFGSTSMGYLSRTTNNANYGTAMGYNTTASSTASFASGSGSIAGGQSSTAMGSYTSASGYTSTAFGVSSVASGFVSTAMGSYTNAYGEYSTSMGYYTTAGANNTTAMGSNVYASNEGSTVIGDSYINSNTMFSPNSNTFSARFRNGYYLYSSATLNSGVILSGGGNSWSTVSDSTRKENFLPINGENVLKKIANMRTVTWNYKGQDPKSFRHYGPMAQEFFNAFGRDKLGVIGNDTTIASADFDGINFTAIKALEKRTSELQTENENLKKQLAILEKSNLEIMTLKTKMEQLEAFLLPKKEELRVKIVSDK